jgi:hypothetical protein
MSCLIWLFVLVINLTLVKSDFFSSHHGLENLIDVQKLIFENLDSYILKEEERLDDLRVVRDKYYDLYRQSSQDVQSFLSHPINVFHLIKALTVEWKSCMNLLFS